MHPGCTKTSHGGHAVYDTRRSSVTSCCTAPEPPRAPWGLCLLRRCLLLRWTSLQIPQDEATHEHHNPDDRRLRHEGVIRRVGIVLELDVHYRPHNSFRDQLWKAQRDERTTERDRLACCWLRIAMSTASYKAVWPTGDIPARASAAAP